MKKTIVAAAAIIALAGISYTASAGLASPTLSCINPTKTTITVRMCAGATGAGAGFSLHWVEKSVYTAAATAAGYADAAAAEADGFWPGSGTCKVSMSGNAAGTVWSLNALDCRDFTIGAPNDPSYDPGLSYDCDITAGLLCDHTYVLRAFAHNIPGSGGNPNLKKSDFSAIIECSTLPCQDANVCSSVCTFSQGAWLSGAANPSTAAYQAIGGEVGFASAFPSSLVVGGTKSLTFTTLAAVAAYPVGGAPAVLTASAVNPPSTSTKNGFASQVIALTLNLAANDDCALAATLDNFEAGNQALGGTALSQAQCDALNGQTLAQVLAVANGVLGGDISPYIAPTPAHGSGSHFVPADPGNPGTGAYGFTVAQLSQLVDLINISAEGCTASAFANTHITGIVFEP